MPSLETDGAAFFPNVLRASEFQRDGILFGDEPASETKDTELKRRLQWAVVDPRKHTLYIWQKTTRYFPDSAIALGASVFTNGPFNLYSGGRSGWTAYPAYWLAVAEFEAALQVYKAIWAALCLSMPYLKGLVNWAVIESAGLESIKDEYFGKSTPEGFIYGRSQSISETTLSRPTHHYFGRDSGTDFLNYSIGKGDSPSIDEVIGGLYRTVDNYANGNDDPRTVLGIRTTNQRHDFGYWGLAPLDLSDPALIHEHLDTALEELNAYDRVNFPQLHPPMGLIVVAFYGGYTDKMADMLIAARVKNAIRIDGSDSVLFGRGAEILVGKGDDMSDYKKLYNKWGYMCLKT